MSYVHLAVLNALLMALGQILWKMGMKNLVLNSFSDIIRAAFTPFVITGLFVYGMTMFLWLYILNRADLSQVYPIQSLAFVFVLIMSAVLFRETLTINRLIGVIIICLGAYIVSIR